ncbi:MauE/DoxX family redox-associated membrane protein [Rhodopirellula sp. MGV]|uniref:MauE/DoxX family redox-associated membrane protein n=1 Tax=Rhodopirellula sp. MGV TaxID=2023130 RepID=UPI000B9665A3|nr:MauE/DoxX family redox-associated membrane protein [Rhodopirellula sp. MGV]OYP35145.1 hypothetical protein CGZ80_12125 [Rhodopirellula sp. MGV]PNY36781.1 hypothetical protein C2E31_11265 [Rhodopirellula baltica]
MSKYSKLLKSVYAVAACFTLLMLAASSYFHLSNPFAFLSTVYRYGVVGPRFSMAVASVIPIASAIAAFFLATGIFRLGSWVIALALSGSFAAAQLILLIQGRVAQCGCFGPAYDEEIGLLSFGRAVALLACAGIGFMIELHFSKNNRIHAEQQL